MFLHNAPLGVWEIVFRILERKEVLPLVSFQVYTLNRDCCAFGVHFKSVHSLSVLATYRKSALLLTFFVPTSLVHKTSENGWIL